MVLYMVFGQSKKKIYKKVEKFGKKISAKKLAKKIEIRACKMIRYAV
jgi:hypothetical protein